MTDVYLLTGSPGAGKTFLIKEAIAGFDLKAGGFYTEEIRDHGLRQGFKITTLDGRSAILSHVTIRSPSHVSKYGVDIKTLDNVGTTALNRAIEKSDLIVVDEIGKMELLSLHFQEAITRALESGKKMLGTIMLGPHPFADKIKGGPHTRVINVSRANHDHVLTEIRQWLGTVKNATGAATTR